MTVTDDSMNIKVIIADDHPIIRAGLHSMLDLAEDIEVIAAVDNTDDAVALAPQADVVLMDLRFGDTPNTGEAGGVDATRRIRAGAPATPQVLVVTNYSTDHDVRTAIAAGAVGYLLKDCTPEQLTDGIRLAAEGKTVLNSAVAGKLVSQLSPAHADLTPRELEVLAAVARGSSNRQIARELVLTEATVKTHLGNVFHKFGVTNRTAAVARARERGIL